MSSKKGRSTWPFANTKKATRRKKVKKYSIRIEMMRFSSSDKIKDNISRVFLSFSWGIFSHVTSLDQFHGSKLYF